MVENSYKEVLEFNQHELHSLNAYTRIVTLNLLVEIVVALLLAVDVLI